MKREDGWEEIELDEEEAKKMIDEFVERRKRELAEQYKCYIVHTDLEIPIQVLSPKREVLENSILSKKKMPVTARSKDEARTIAIKSLREYGFKLDRDYKIFDIEFIKEYHDPLKEYLKTRDNIKYSKNMKFTGRSRKTTK